MERLGDYQRIPYLKRIVWQPYNDENQPEKSVDIYPESAVVLPEKVYEKLVDATKKLKEAQTDGFNKSCDGCENQRGNACLISVNHCGRQADDYYHG